MFIVEELSAIFFTKEIYVTNFMHISCVSSTIGNLRIFPVEQTRKLASLAIMCSVSTQVYIIVSQY